MKRGRLSEEEKVQIINGIKSKDAATIAKEINRTEAVVTKYIEDVKFIISNNVVEAQKPLVAEAVRRLSINDVMVTKTAGGTKKAVVAMTEAGSEKVDANRTNKKAPPQPDYIYKIFDEMKYTSIFSPDKKVSAAQYITELVCKNKANFLKVELPAQFWTFPEWANFYKSQIIKCGPLLENYEAAILIKVIKEKNIYSLYPRWIHDEFSREQRRVSLESSNNKEEVIHTRVVNSKGLNRKKKDFGKFDNE